MSDHRKYAVILTPDEEQENVLNVTVPDLPGCLTWGFGRREALKSAKEAIDLYLSVADKQAVCEVGYFNNLV